MKYYKDKLLFLFKIKCTDESFTIRPGKRIKKSHLIYVGFNIESLECVYVCIVDVQICEWSFGFWTGTLYYFPLHMEWCLSPSEKRRKEPKFNKTSNHSRQKLYLLRSNDSSLFIKSNTTTDALHMKSYFSPHIK